MSSSKNIKRTAEIQRKTNETNIAINICLDGNGTLDADCGVPFLEHMLDQIARHGLIDITLHAKGDLAIDAHHTVEDIGICLGQALAKALDNKRGINRYGHAYVPLDEALARVVLDCSGRPSLHYDIPFRHARIGEFEVDLFREFFQAFVNHAQLTLHIDVLRGTNDHHMIECVFKAFGRALRQAITMDARQGNTMPSTKGML
ncbi:MAG: imidazoleglycerol-phosphate dehydratase HisB [Mariprofundales bacterium]